METKRIVLGTVALAAVVAAAALALPRLQSREPAAPGQARQETVHPPGAGTPPPAAPGAGNPDTGTGGAAPEPPEPPPPPAPPAPAPVPGSPEDPEFQAELLAEFDSWCWQHPWPDCKDGAMRTIRGRMEDKSATPEDYRRLAELTGEPADDRTQRDWLIAVVKRGKFPGTREEWRSPACRKALTPYRELRFDALGRYGRATAVVLDALLGVEGVNGGKPMGLLGACEHVVSLMTKAGWFK